MFYSAGTSIAYHLGNHQLKGITPSPQVSNYFGRFVTWIKGIFSDERGVQRVSIVAKKVLSLKIEQVGEAQPLPKEFKARGAAIEVTTHSCDITPEIEEHAESLLKQIEVTLALPADIGSSSESTEARDRAIQLLFQIGTLRIDIDDNDKEMPLRECLVILLRRSDLTTADKSRAEAMLETIKMRQYSRIFSTIAADLEDQKKRPQAVKFLETLKSEIKTLGLNTKNLEILTKTLVLVEKFKNVTGPGYVSLRLRKIRETRQALEERLKPFIPHTATRT